jgi:hypothetical protein
MIGSGIKPNGIVALAVVNVMVINIIEPIENTIIDVIKYTYFVLFDLSNLRNSDSNAQGNTIDVTDIHAHLTLYTGFIVGT